MLHQSSRTGLVLHHPLLKDVSFDERFGKILTLSPFYNLRNLSQLGPLPFADGFIAANRSRLQHSVGVYSNMKNYIKKHLDIFQRCPNPNKVIDAFLLAAIGHDIGHLPFCHGLERKEYQDNHEKRTLKLFIEYKDVINNIFGYDIVSIVLIILGKADFNMVSTIDAETYNLCTTLRVLIDSPIDCDRLEYIRTDRWNLFGEDVDFAPIFDYSVLYDDNGKYTLAYLSDALPLIEEFLITRRNLYLWAYYAPQIMLLEMILRAYQLFCLGRNIHINQMSEFKIISDLDRLSMDKQATLFERRCGQIITQGVRENLLFTQISDTEEYHNFLNNLMQIIPASLVLTYEKHINTYKGGISILSDNHLVDFGSVSSIAMLPSISLNFVLVDLDLCPYSAKKDIQKVFDSLHQFLLI